MDRFIVSFNNILTINLKHLKSNMDRFIVVNNYDIINNTEI